MKLGLEAVAAILLAVLVGCGSHISGHSDSTDPTPTPQVLTAKNLNQCSQEIVAEQTFKASETTKHQTGRLSSNGWYTDQTFPAGYMTYGPYVKNLKMGSLYKITFSLRIDFPNALDAVAVAFIDVYDHGQGAQFLASRTLHRNDFSQKNVAQDFVLYAFLPNKCNNGIEARVFWAPPGGVNTQLEHLSTTFTPMTSKDFDFTGSEYLPMLENMIQARNTVAFSAWIKTKETEGVIFGTQTVAANQPLLNGWVPNLYVDNQGKLRGCWWTGTQGTECAMTSASVVNDEKWHHVALLGNVNYQSLMIDGAIVATKSANLMNNNGLLFNQIGTGYTDFWPGFSSGGWKAFRGKIRDPRLFAGGTDSNYIKDIFAAGVDD